MKKLMKAMITAIVALATLFTLGILATAEESEVIVIPEIAVEIKTYTTLQEAGIYELVNEMKAALPEQIEESYEGGVLTVPNPKAASAQFYSYTDYNMYDMTLVDGYWTLEIEESMYNEGGLIYYYGIDGEWKAEYRRGYREYISLYLGDANYSSCLDIYRTHISFIYKINMKNVSNTYDLDGNLIENEVMISTGDYDVITVYNQDKQLVYAHVYLNDWHYYFAGQGWSESYNEYIPTDAPAGWEEADDAYFRRIAPTTIPCDHSWNDDTPKTCEICGATEGDPFPKPVEPDTPDEPTSGEHLDCEANWLANLWNIIVNFFRQLFGMPVICVCGEEL